MKINHIGSALQGSDSKVDYDDLWDGTQASPCPLPCTTWSTDTRLLGEYARVNKNTSRINLTFAPKVNTGPPQSSPCNKFNIISKVQVTTTSYLKFYLSNFFSDLGGSLGLWMGIGILQVLLLFKALFYHVSSDFNIYICVSDPITQVFEIVCKCLLPALSKVFDKNLGSKK